MATGQHRNTTTRDRHRAAIRSRRDDCGICNTPIDYTIRSPHPDSFEVDHIIPRNAGGPDTLDNKQAAHRRCNRAKSDKLVQSQPVSQAISTWRGWWLGGKAQTPRHTPTSVSQRVTLVAGPPCSGKNTYVTKHAAPGDVVIDYDAIMTEITGRNTHDHDAALERAAHDIRDRRIADLIASDKRGWIISSSPRVQERYEYGAHVILLLPMKATALARAKRERPAAWASYINRWYARYQPDPRDQIIIT